MLKTMTLVYISFAGKPQFWFIIQP